MDIIKRCTIRSVCTYNVMQITAFASQTNNNILYRTCTTVIKYTPMCYAFRKIFLPGIRQGLVSAVLMVFIPAIGSYVIPQMLGGTNCVLIGNKIFMRAIQNRNIPHASALATLMAVSVLLPMGLAMWWRRRQTERDRKRLEIRTAQLMTTGGSR